MILSETMVHTLHAIQQNESPKVVRALKNPSKELGYCLISVYYNTSDLKTRELITSFMSEAGNSWLRKLLTRDLGEKSSFKSGFASVSDFMSILPANDTELSAAAS